MARIVSGQVTWQMVCDFESCNCPVGGRLGGQIVFTWPQAGVHRVSRREPWSDSRRRSRWARSTRGLGCRIGHRRSTDCAFCIAGCVRFTSASECRLTAQIPMIENQPILIVGGTRGTGLLIARLLEQRHASVRALARDPARARAVLGPGVEVFEGDITKQDTLPPAVKGATHIIFTAGCRSGHPASESRIKATEFEGVLNTLATVRLARCAGRFMYMTSSGVATHSLLSVGLNLYKGNTLGWRRRTCAFRRR